MQSCGLGGVVDKFFCEFAFVIIVYGIVLITADGVDDDAVFREPYNSYKYSKLNWTAFGCLRGCCLHWDGVLLFRMQKL